MHRTEGDGRVEEAPGIFRFHDQALPTYIGTVDTAEFNNAVQEELCNVITMVGGAVASSAAVDRAAGWHQLYDAIFLGGHINDNAVDSLSFARIAPPLNWIDGKDEVTLDAGGLIFDGLGGDTFDATAGALYLNTSAQEMNISGRGINYAAGYGNVAEFKTAYFRKVAYAVTGAAWAPIGSSDISCWQCSTDIITDLPVAQVPLTGIIGAWIHYDNSITTYPTPAQPAIRELGGSGFWQVTWMNVLSTAEPPSEFTLILEFDAKNLV